MATEPYKVLKSIVGYTGTDYRIGDTANMGRKQAFYSLLAGKVKKMPAKKKTKKNPSDPSDLTDTNNGGK